VTIDKIFAAVYKKYNIAKDEIVGKRRNKEIANARHVAIYLIREITEISLPNIGKIFDRDHSTVMSSLDWVKRRIMAEPIFNADIENLRKEIQGR
jgi:chromosomal replication initiator protein